MNDFDEAIANITRTKPVHPGDKNPTYLHKNHPVRFVLEHAANCSDIRDDGTRIDYGYADHLEGKGFGEHLGVVEDAITKIREHARTGSNGEARRLANDYAAEIASKHLTPDERIAR